MNRGKPTVLKLRDLEIEMVANCTNEDCLGVCAQDGTSWWCEECGGTWTIEGQQGERWV